MVNISEISSASLDKQNVKYGSGNIFSNEFNKNTFFLYDIANYEYPQVIFWYGVMLVVFLYIFSCIDFSISLFIGIIFFSILLYYLWYSRKINTTNELEKNNIKTDIINPNQSSPKNREDLLINNYPDIVDFMFYMKEFKSFNLDVYNIIIYTFNNIIYLYESIKKDKSLVNTYYYTINNLKLSILQNIESFNYKSNNIIYSKKIIELKKKAENIIDKYMAELLLIYKKNIYYNNYNIDTKIITNKSLLPYNEFYNLNENIRNTTPFKISDVFVI